MSIILTLTAADGATSTLTVPDPNVTVVNSVPFNIGETTILSTTDNGNGNLILGQPATLSQVGTLQSLSFYVGTVGGNLHLGIYSDASGKPGTKLAEVAEFTPVVGWNTKPTTTTPTLQPGNYWLVYFPQSNSLGFRKITTGVTSYFKSLTYGTMPTTFPSSPSSTTSHWSFYATLLGTVTGPGPLSTNNSSFVANPTQAQINSPINLTITTIDTNSNPVSNASVSLSANGTNNNLAPSSGTTNSSGIFVATLTSNTVQSETITAVITGGTPSSNINFNVGVNFSNNSYADGSLNAPVGTAQLPNLFAPSSANPGTYIARPPWKVAGVDYHVGVDRSLYSNNTIMKNPTTASLPSGVSRSGTNMTISGSNIVLDGFDFSLGGGWTLNVNGSNNTIQNCYFAVGSNNKGPMFINGNGNLIINCEFHINAPTQNPDPAMGVNMPVNSTNTFEYCYFENGYGVLLASSPNFGGETYIMRWCMLHNSGYGFSISGVHGDWIQYYDNTGTHIAQEIDFLFCTFVQDIDISIARCQGLSILSASVETSFCNNIRIENNTFIAHKPGTNDVPNSTGAYVNFGILVDWHWIKNNGGTILNNYIDQKGMDSWFYGGPDYNGKGTPWGMPFVSGNIDMRSGSLLTSWSDQYQPVAVATSFNLNHTGLVNGQLVGTIKAYNGPTTWSITSGNSSGFYAIDNNGNITVTAAGVSGITTGTTNLTCLPTNSQATNGTATSAIATITVI